MALRIVTQKLRVSDMFVGVKYSGIYVVADGGAPPYTYSEALGYLPDGLLIRQDTGEILGTPLKSGNFYFTLKVMDSLDAIASQSYLITVTSAVIELSPVSSFISNTVIVKDNFHQKYLYDYVPFTIKDIKDT